MISLIFSHWCACSANTQVWIIHSIPSHTVPKYISRSEWGQMGLGCFHGTFSCCQVCFSYGAKHRDGHMMFQSGPVYKSREIRAKRRPGLFHLSFLFARSLRAVLGIHHRDNFSTVHLCHRVYTDHRHLKLFGWGLSFTVHYIYSTSREFNSERLDCSFCYRNVNRGAPSFWFNKTSHCLL